MDFQNYKNQKIVVLIALLLVSSFLFWLFGSNNGEQVILRFSVRNSAQDGWQCMLNYRGNFPNPSVPWVIKKINDEQCGGGSLIEALAQKRWEKFSSHPYYPVFERFFSDWGSYKISDSVKTAMSTPQEGYNKVLPEAMYCDQAPLNDSFENRAFLNIAEETGYDLTHKFLSAVLFKENGCVTQNYNIDEVILSAAVKMAQAQEESAEVDDLYMERTAFLLGFGFRDLVKEEWIKRIIDAQDKSGAWVTQNFFDKNFKDPHTAILAIWALSEYVEYCPFSSN